MSARSRTAPLRVLAVAVLLASLAACRQDMHDQPRYDPLEGSDFFADGRASRPAVDGTVARGQLNADEALYTAKVGEELVATFPIEVTAELLARGRERFEIYCAPCHDRVGDGRGMVVQRGYRAPPSFHIDRLRAAPPGYIFDVITNGFGAMPDYRAQVKVRDRWAIVAYVQALQLSQRARLADVPAEARPRLDAGPARSEPPPPVAEVPVASDPVAAPESAEVPR